MHFDELDVKDRLKEVLEDSAFFSCKTIEKIAFSVCCDIYDNIVNDKCLDPEEDKLEDLDESSFRDCYWQPVQEYIDSHFIFDEE